MSVLEITGKEISELNDSDLRSLVGLLCECEVTSAGLSTSGVTWGGNQDAKDGGIDVRVAVARAPRSDGYVPRAKTGFQVKKPKMRRANILSEMCPNGEIRDSIRELAETGGAYIIVSGTASTTDSALATCQRAMRNAVGSIDGAKRLVLDFYDRDRLASWVRSHPSMILWIREKLGRPLRGWKGYDNWAHSPEGLSDEYLADNELRIHNDAHAAEGLSALAGMDRLRGILRHPRKTVRLVGLSGVGKTRLVQALFDDRIGENPLPFHQVFYTDIGNNPLPDPCSLAEQLIAKQKPGVLIVDNCPPKLHRDLTIVCIQPHSTLSLLTVEYDIREDQPEETDVFRLEPASIGLMEKVVERRFPNVGHADAHKIAEFSGGNARIAIALGNTVKKGESLTDFKDDVLLRRLFDQRNEPDDNLFRAAEACALVYSFDVRTEGDAPNETGLLAKLAGTTIDDLHRNVSELKRRDLVQQRGYWRAVLPHAIANALARRALENIPKSKILEAFVDAGNERLLTSFSRRLGYLHDSEVAVEIVEEWLSEEGFLGNLNNSYNFPFHILRNVAPTAPEATLKAMERAADGANGGSFVSLGNGWRTEYAWILQSIAYEPALFDRASTLLIRLVLAEANDQRGQSVRGNLEPFFRINFSGTHASCEQRLAMIKQLVNHDSDKKLELGLLLLGNALRTCWGHHFVSVPEFGAHPRDMGYAPETDEEIHKWYTSFLDLTVELVTSQKPISEGAKAVLAEAFRYLWNLELLYDDLECAIRRISKSTTWDSGWFAISKVIRIDQEEMPSDIAARLTALHDRLSPVCLLEKARAYAFMSYREMWSMADDEIDGEGDFSERHIQFQESVRQIGREIAGDEVTLQDLLPQTVSREGAGLFNLGQGLADGSKVPLRIWESLRKHLAATAIPARNFTLPCGFLVALARKDVALSERLLEESIDDDVLAQAYPHLQAPVGISASAISRFERSLSNPDVPASPYQCFRTPEMYEGIGPEKLAEFILTVSQKSDGLPVAMEILSSIIHRAKRNESELSPHLISVGQDILATLDIGNSEHKIIEKDYQLAEIVSACLKGENSHAIAQRMSQRYGQALVKNHAAVRDYPRTVCAIADSQPLALLDGFFRDNDIPHYRIKSFFSDCARIIPNPLMHVDDATVITWCEADPDKRYPLMALAIVPYREDPANEAIEWTSLALSILASAPEPLEVLKQFDRVFRPTAWSGSKADLMRRRVRLLVPLKEHRISAIAEWARDEECVLIEQAEQERIWHEAREAEMHNRFE
jgi:hypothetical protein